MIILTDWVMDMHPTWYKTAEMFFTAKNSWHRTEHKKTKQYNKKLFITKENTYTLHLNKSNNTKRWLLNLMNAQI